MKVGHSWRKNRFLTLGKHKIDMDADGAERRFLNGWEGNMVDHESRFKGPEVGLHMLSVVVEGESLGKRIWDSIVEH